MKFYLGVDGGGSKSTIRVEDEQHHLVGEVASGPANIRISVTQSWDSIMNGLRQILNPIPAESEIYAVMGLAGCEIKPAYDAFLKENRFKKLHVTSDAHIACIGAHGGEDGAIVIAGTGVVGFQVFRDSVKKVSGWGFPHDDIGGGAWLGVEAVKTTLQSLDGRRPNSLLAERVLNHFQDRSLLVEWANKTNSTGFAELAPLVIKAAEEQDEISLNLLKNAARALEEVYLAFGDLHLKCALLGGIAPFVKNFLSQPLQQKLVPCQKSPVEGATLLATKLKREEL